MKNKNVLVVHGGAWDIPGSEESDHIKGLKRSLKKGWERLRQGGTSIDAVEAAVVVMEDDPVFDAGKGSVLNIDGSVEMDASIMDGKTFDAGAVAALRNFSNPIKISRKILENTEHILLAGRGCEEFAIKNGFKKVPVEELLTSRELKRLDKLNMNGSYQTKYSFSRKKGTVGAVAIDSAGNIAAATSTGGTPKKIPGRVGDTALIGCGTYAENGIAGVSCSGWGESIIKVMLARETAETIRNGARAQTAAEHAVFLLKQRCDGLGGVICVDFQGEIGIYFNTPKMARGYINSDINEPVVEIKVL